MQIERLVIVFCYAFIAGIAVSMAAPSDPGILGALSVAVALALMSAGAGSIRVRRLSSSGRDREAIRAGRWLMLMLAVAGGLLGYVRHLAANTEPDMRLGTIRFDAAGARLDAAVPLAEASRLRIVKEAAWNRDIGFRVVGEIKARVPVRDPAGGATMDEAGRWVFDLAPLAVTSDVVTLRASDPVGASVSLPQPG